MNRRIRRQQVRRNLSRRQFIGRGAAFAGAVALGPTILAACGGDDDDDAAGGSGGGGGNSLHVDSWPLYLDEESAALFEEQTGISLTYTTVVNDNNEYFATIQPSLSSGDKVDADIFVLTGWMAKRLIDLGWVDELPIADVPNAKNLVDSLVNPAWDPTGKFSLPWQSGLTGIAYNRAAAGRELMSVEDLFDPEFRGKIGFLLEMNDSLGLVLRADGVDPENVTFEQAGPAFDRVEAAVADGQIRQFTGNDYQDDLIAGNFVACVSWSGDVGQLALDEPDLAFVIPDEGGMIWSDTMLMPKGTENIEAVAEWMNFCYDPVNAARIAAYVGFLSPVQGVQEELRKSEDTAALADSEVMFPPPTADVLAFNPNLDEEERALFDDRWAEITTG